MFERAKERLPLIRPLLVPAVLYFGLVALATGWISENPDSIWRFGVALLPMLPGLWLAAGVVNAIRKLDELNRKILLESAAIAFVATLVLLLSLGFLGWAGLPQPNSLYTTLVMLIFVLVAKLVLSRKYQ